jgi:hypothetical protein
MGTPVRVSTAQPESCFPSRSPQMQVRKRSGSPEPVDVDTIVRARERCSEGQCAPEDARRMATSWLPSTGMGTQCP